MAMNTLDDLIDYIARYKEHIYVREQLEIDGKWRSYALTELPANLAIDHALSFIKEGRVPVRMLQEEEIEKE